MSEHVCPREADPGASQDILRSSPLRPAVPLPDIPVRRFGSVPPLEDDIAYEVVQDAAAARTIAEYGSAAVWMAGLSVACLAGLALYVA